MVNYSEIISGWGPRKVSELVESELAGTALVLESKGVNENIMAALTRA
eukprot:CAMPEP_0172583632 /NCGR_PEP_ID=MMETSP1068-20121228/3237_1 /TAXON_ID=35684 /ORGANISM="Pseudopedinella elastica, Strain CCMP716" /LENGTH=47 /DNA_ID= /DNA_START= /DNA_END= /DNA_ORIENTATION=